MSASYDGNPVYNKMAEFLQYEIIIKILKLLMSLL